MKSPAQYHTTCLHIIVLCVPKCGFPSTTQFINKYQVTANQAERPPEHSSSDRNHPETILTANNHLKQSSRSKKWQGFRLGRQRIHHGPNWS